MWEGLVLCIDGGPVVGKEHVGGAGGGWNGQVLVVLSTVPLV